MAYVTGTLKEVAKRHPDTVRPESESDLSGLSESKLVELYKRVLIRFFQANSRNQPKAKHYARRLAALAEEFDRRGLSEGLDKRLLLDKRFFNRVGRAIDFSKTRLQP